MRSIRFFCLIVLLVSIAGPLNAAEKVITLVHSNDLHSHLLGSSPNIDYTPLETGNDSTIGGWARIATVIRDIKENRTNPVLVVDAGDFLMGSLFHMLSREESFELRLMKAMGYDVTTLGNHEFDLRPAGLARIILTAQERGEIPSIVSSNVVFSGKSRADDELEEVFAEGLVVPSLVMERNGIRIGFFGLMGKDAAEVSPFAPPVTFEDPVAAAERIVRRLREEDKADIVVCLSHSGLSDDLKKSEDEILAEKVAGIDIIISGHTHTKTDVRRVNDTMIVQAWCYGKQLGVMDIGWSDGRVYLKNYRLIDIDDSIRGDARITAMIDTCKDHINKKILAGEGLEFNTIIAHTPFNLEVREDECNLGNLIADSIRWSVNKNDSDPGDPATRVEIGVVSNGVIRDDIVTGRSGNIAVCDAFAPFPWGSDSTSPPPWGILSYPFISIRVKSRKPLKS